MTFAQKSHESAWALTADSLSRHRDANVHIAENQQCCATGRRTNTTMKIVNVIDIFAAHRNGACANHHLRRWVLSSECGLRARCWLVLFSRFLIGCLHVFCATLLVAWCYAKKIWNASRIRVSSLRRGHANLLCIVPILLYVRKRTSVIFTHL